MHTHQITSHSVCIMHIIAYGSVPELLHKVHSGNEQIRVTAHKSLRTSARHKHRAMSSGARAHDRSVPQNHMRADLHRYVCVYMRCICLCMRSSGSVVHACVAPAMWGPQSSALPCDWCSSTRSAAACPIATAQQHFRALRSYAAVVAGLSSATNVCACCDHHRHHRRSSLWFWSLRCRPLSLSLLLPLSPEGVVIVISTQQLNRRLARKAKSQHATHTKRNALAQNHIFIYPVVRADIVQIVLMSFYVLRENKHTHIVKEYFNVDAK